MSVNMGGSFVRRVVVVVAVVVLAGSLPMTIARGIRAGIALAASPTKPMEPAGERRNLPLEGLTARDIAASTPDRVPLGEVGRAVIMVFDPACGPCGVNMGNWTDLVREARGHSVEMLALAVEPADGAEEYWRGWSGVRVVATDSSTVRDDLRLRVTPTTLLVEDGVVRTSYAGPLSPRSMAELLAWIREK